MTFSARQSGAVGDGVTNDMGAIASAIAACQAAGDGLIEIEPGNYFCPGLSLPPNLTLWGHGAGVSVLQSMAVDSPVISLEPGSGHQIRDLGIYGRNDPSTGTNALWIPPGVVGAALRNLTIWFGYSALYIQGTDCDLDNCYIGNSYHGAAITSNGANWYRRCKVDSLAAAIVGGKPSAYKGWFHGGYADGSLCENHFDMCDFSGCYDNSILIADMNQNSVTAFTNSVFSAPVVIQGHRATQISGCEFGGDVSNGAAGPVILIGNVAIGSINTSGNIIKAGNSSGVN